MWYVSRSVFVVSDMLPFNAVDYSARRAQRRYERITRTSRSHTTSRSVMFLPLAFRIPLSQHFIPRFANMIERRGRNSDTLLHLKGNGTDKFVKERAGNFSTDSVKTIDCACYKL